MSDIVDLAKERRARLIVEMAKLDEFIQMAEGLLNPEDEGDADILADSESLSYGDDLLMGDDHFLLNETGHADDASGDAATEEEDEAAEDELLLTDAVPDGDAKLDAHVGMRIRHRRWMMGIDQQELARLAGITVGQVQRFEAGDSRVGTRQMREIAAAMKVPMAFFLEGLIDDAGGTGQSGESRDGARPDR